MSCWQKPRVRGERTPNPGLVARDQETCMVQGTAKGRMSQHGASDISTLAGKSNWPEDGVISGQLRCVLRDDPSGLLRMLGVRVLQRCEDQTPHGEERPNGRVSNHAVSNDPITNNSSHVTHQAGELQPRPARTVRYRLRSAGRKSGRPARGRSHSPWSSPACHGRC